MTVIFTPPDGSLLGTFNVDDVISLSITAYDDTFQHNVTNIDIVLDVTYAGVTTTSGDPATINGSYHIDLFNHSATYVDQGESDKTQTPITTPILDVPDFKEVYQVNVDSSDIITINATATVTLDDLSTAVGNFTIDVNNNIPLIKTWTDDYFSTRY